MRTFLHGGTIVRLDGVEHDRTIVCEDGRIADLVDGRRRGGAGDEAVDVSTRLIVPAFIDAHVHGAAGVDVMDGPGAVARVAAALSRWGVAAFCPTSIACAAGALASFLSDVEAGRAAPGFTSARVIGAHLESNFLNPAYRGAQPGEHLLAPIAPAAGPVLDSIARAGDVVAIVTLAPEMPGGIDLVRRLTAAGRLVSLGHSGATFDQAIAAIDAGASRATHLFNAMPAVSARDPGLVGAVLAHEAVRAELIGDGIHVHPALMRTTMAAKGAARVLAITDGTAASGLPRGSRARLGTLSITAADVARLDDGGFGGSVLTMDRAFATLVRTCGCSLAQAARMCATTPAEDLRLTEQGRIDVGCVADFAVLDEDLSVAETWITARRAWPRDA